MRNFSALLLAAACAFVSGCASERTAFPSPEVSMPDRWTAPSAGNAGEPTGPWWRNFKDAQLDALIERVLRSNSDLSIAALRVHRAQLVAGLVDTHRTPSVSVSAAAAVARSFDPGGTARSSGVNASAVLETDPWGKLAAERDVAALEAAATKSDCQGVAAALSVATAQLYWRVAYLNQVLALSEADIAYAQKALEVVRAKHDAGAVSALGAAQAQLYLSNLQAAHTQLLQQRVEARHALAILFDQPPQSAVAERASLPDQPLPDLAAGLPASVLAHRPDLLAAELRLRAALANVDFTRASFYPTLTLTGSLGTASTALASFLKSPLLTLGAGLSLPFVQWNTMRLNIRVSETQYEEAVANFRQRLYVALKEVEDGLSARAQLLAEADKLALALTHARRAESIAQSRYVAGATEAQLWFDAQQFLRNAERSLATNRLNQLENQARLYQALGLAGSKEGIACPESVAGRG
jgi:NodT family efflux transporter outer membrane factor (OMF) lipoprotein